MNLLQHAMLDRASYADLQAVVSSLAHQFFAQAAENWEDIPQDKKLPLPSISDVAINLLHQRLSTKADAAVVEDLPAPSSLISDVMRASEGAAEPQPSAFHPKARVIAPYIPPGAAAEAASMATMQRNLSALHAERDMADSTQTGDSPPSPRQEPSTGTANADQSARELAPQKAGTVSNAASSKRAAASKSLKEERVLPERAVSQSRDASVLAALHALEQSMAALHQHVSRVQLESRSDRLQLNRLAKDVQMWLEGGVLKGVRLQASDSPRLPASDAPTGKLSTLDEVDGKLRTDSLTSGELIGAATLKEAQIHAELLELRRALETVTAVTGMMALGRREMPLLKGFQDGMEATKMETTVSALARAMDAHQVHKRGFEDLPSHTHDLVHVMQPTSGGYEWPATFLAASQAEQECNCDALQRHEQGEPDRSTENSSQRHHP
ncbi:g5004 [Coccomyxa elongata]